MGFNAELAVEPMEYDFTKYGGKVGVVPEPSQKAFRKYTRALTLLTGDMQALGKASEREDLTDIELKELNDKAEKLSDTLDSLVAELCQNVPTAEEVALLPYRVKVAFSKWLQKEFSPEAETSGTKQ